MIKEVVVQGHRLKITLKQYMGFQKNIWEYLSILYLSL